jgi:hypothetical protein
VTLATDLNNRAADMSFFQKPQTQGRPRLVAWTPCGKRFEVRSSELELFGKLNAPTLPSNFGPGRHWTFKSALTEIIKRTRTTRELHQSITRLYEGKLYKVKDWFHLLRCGIYF